MYCDCYDSPVGMLLLTCDGQALTGLWMNRAEPEEGLRGHPVLERTKAWLDDYFAGRPRAIDVPLNPAGSEFRRLVWRELLDIPYGKTVTYGELAQTAARQLGRQKMSAQAIGGAVGANPISILIPCHRVVGAGGKLTGYAGGLEKKAWLLRHEGWLSSKGLVVFDSHWTNPA